MNSTYEFTLKKGQKMKMEIFENCSPFWGHDIGHCSPFGNLVKSLFKK